MSALDFKELIETNVEEGQVLLKILSLMPCHVGFAPLVLCRYELELLHIYCGVLHLIVSIQLFHIFVSLYCLLSRCCNHFFHIFPLLFKLTFTWLHLLDQANESTVLLLADMTASLLAVTAA